MIKRHLPSLIFLFGAIPYAHAAEPATTQSIEQRMIELAPVLSIDDPQTTSLDVQIVMGQGAAKMQVRALYGGEGRRALYLSDPRDGTPLCVIADGRLLMYDPIDGALLASDEATGQLELRQDGNSLSLNFGFNARQKDKPSAWALTVDVASIVNRSKDTAVEELGGGVYGLRQRGKKPGSMLYAAIDPQRPSPYMRLEIISDEEPVIVVDPLKRNEPIDAAAFKLPTNEELAQRIPVKKWPGEGILAGARSVQAFMRILLARLASDDPKWRAQLDASWVTRVNWAKVKENDARLAPILREIFPLASTAPSGGAPATKPAADSNGPGANTPR